MIVGALRNVVKVLACVIISGILGLESWNVFSQGALYTNWQMVFWFGRFVLISHGLEAIAAALYAPGKKKAPLSYGLYTFFVGTIGLVELFQLSQPKLDQNQ